MDQELISFDDEEVVRVKVGDVLTIIVDESTEIEIEVREIKKKVN